jgi:hypothetical protein
MFYFFELKNAMIIAVVVLNTIAVIAMIIAHRELRKALREMDKLSSSRASRRSSSLLSSQSR